MKRIRPILVLCVLFVVSGSAAANQRWLNRIARDGEWELMYETDFAYNAWSANPEQLRVMRNMVYAIRGQRFRSPDLVELFSGFDWYQAMVDDAGDRLTQYDRFLTAFIISLEGGDWFAFLRPSDWLAILSVEQGLSRWLWPAVKFLPNGTFGYVSTPEPPGVPLDRSSDTFAATGEWRLDDERVDVRITSVRFIGGPGREGTSYGPEPVREPRWIRFADLRSFEFPKAEFEYRKFYGTAAPATLEIQGLRLVDGDVLPVEPVRVYQESFLNPGFQPAD